MSMLSSKCWPYINGLTGTFYEMFLMFTEPLGSVWSASWARQGSTVRNVCLVTMETPWPCRKDSVKVS